MMDPRELEQFVESVMTGERELTDPEVRRALDANPELAIRVAELRELAEQLNQAGVEQRETLNASRELQAAPADAESTTLLRALHSRASTSDSRPLSTSSRALFLAAAAVLLALPFAWHAWITPASSAAPTDTVLLGSNQFDLEIATRDESALAGLRWNYPLTAGGWFSLEIWDAKAPAGSPALHSIPRYTGSEWNPTEQLPPLTRVQITAHNAGGEVEDSWIGELSFPR